jgi:predicted MFS family arabinose efflux permease
VTTPAMAQAGGEISIGRAVLAGTCASLVGIGLARFAYTPLVPVLVTEQWFTPAQAAYLGGANLAGYLAGALLARQMNALAPVSVVMRAMMVLATASFFACAHPVAFSWFFIWRFMAGVSGGVLMVLAAHAVLPRVPVSRHGLAGGAIFTGVGLGIAASGILVPALLRWGLSATWDGLGILSLMLTLLAWTGWPPSTRSAAIAEAGERPLRSSAALRALYVEYGLNAVGLVPHMIFLVDFIARGLRQGLVAGARYWVVFGIGAMGGPLLAGFVADRIGFHAALRLAFLVQALSVALVVAADGPAALLISSAVIGAFTPGIVPLALGRVNELVAGEQGLKRAWSLCTVAFALGQAGAAYGFSYVFAQTGGAYRPLFAAAAAALLLALAIDFVWQRKDAEAT